MNLLPQEGFELIQEMNRILRDLNPRNEPNESFIQRAFTDVDTVIGLLNGIIDYYTRNGNHDFIKNWLQVDIPEEHQLNEGSGRTSTG